MRRLGDRREISVVVRLTILASLRGYVEQKKDIGGQGAFVGKCSPAGSRSCQVNADRVTL